jgi:thiosulfate/3-mercaptopyruvate sulfurtransferase
MVSPVLVSTEWLAARLDDPNVVVVDMRWREDGTGRALFRAGHVPGAMYLNWSRDIVDPAHRTAFMLAPPERFAAALAARGIGDRSVVVAYSDRGGSGPYRLWWASRVYGHDDVRILDGGMDRWRAEGWPVTGATIERRQATWRPGPGEALVATADDVEAARDAADAVVLDSRPPDQFRGEFVWFETGPIAADPDGIARTPRGDLRAGRVPGAANVPWATLYRDDLTMKSAEELHDLFVDAGATEGCRVVTYCGVGISASALLYALRRAGFDDVKLYDGSWDEWGRSGRPVARG